MPLVIPDDASFQAGLSESVARIEFNCRLFETGVNNVPVRDRRPPARGTVPADRLGAGLPNPPAA